MRTFVAIPLDKPLRWRIHQLQEQLRPHFVGARWTPVHQLHLTLKFLGEITPQQAILLRDALAPRVAELEPFVLELREVGAFPRLSMPKVLWLGVGEGREQVRALHLKVEETAARLGFPLEEKEFRPHVTIGRLKGDREGPAGWEHLRAAMPAARVKSIQIIESKLTPRGPVYSLFSDLFLGEAKGD